MRKVGTIWYIFNSSKGLQEKPILEDDGELWVGKLIENPIRAANEFMAFLLRDTLGLWGFGIPELKKSFYRGEDYLLSKYISNSFPYRQKGSPFQVLSDDQRQVGILNVIMANFDGNFNNLLLDEAGVVWSYDYEYSGNFDNYEQSLLNNGPDFVYEKLAVFLLPGPLNTKIFDRICSDIEYQVREGKISKSSVRNLCKKAGYPSDVIEKYEDGIWNNISHIRSKMEFILHVWNSFCKSENLNKGNASTRNIIIPFYKTEGYRCTITALKMVLEAKVRDLKVSIEQLERLINSRSDKWVYLIQLAQALHRLEISYRYYASRKRLEYVLDCDFELEMKGFYGDFADRILSHTDEEIIRKTIRFILMHGNLTEIIPSVEMLKNELKLGNLIICLVDNSVINNYSDNKRFHPHAIVITEISGTNIFFHDTGPMQACPNKQVNVNTFLEGWKMGWFDYDLLIVENL